MITNLEAQLAALPTLSEEELARTLAISPASLAQIAATVAQNPKATLEPAGFVSITAGQRALEGLGGGYAERIEEGLILGATIGEGGMGLVRNATQRSLGRRVAVKTLRPQLKNAQAALRLLREAWVTGALEHPNIVPVYDVGLGEDGTPVIVLKHIEGLAWSELIHDAAAVKARFGADDVLEWSLRILVQLCNAVSLAHVRGIVHRDLKPENVMVGRFGEVYLVDWGIAVSLRDDPSGRMPLASEANEPAGTPSYMAPEMLGGMGKLGEHTDVYLLGAILYEILAARPPHVGADFREIVASILRSKFEYPSHAPPELVAIANRAMCRKSEDRFASADELRQRLEWYLRHRGSLALSGEAMKRLDDMRAVLTSPREAKDLRDRVHHLFAEARFGFRQAVRACEDNELATEGLREATQLVVAFELSAGLPEAAAAALAELDSPPAELAKRVADALRSRDAEKLHIAGLEKLSADLDPATGVRTRTMVGVVIGSLWTVVLEGIAQLYPGQSRVLPYWTFYVVTAGGIALSFAVATWGRESLRKTAVNRRTAVAAGLMFAMQLTIELGAHLLGLADAVSLPLHLYCWFFAVTVYALFVARRFWPSAVGIFVAFLVACTAPAQALHAMSAAALLLTLNFGIGWNGQEKTRRTS